MMEPNEPHYEATQKSVKAVEPRGRVTLLTSTLSDNIDHLESALEALYEKIKGVTGPDPGEVRSPMTTEESPEQSDLSEWLEKKARYVEDLTESIKRLTNRVEL